MVQIVGVEVSDERLAAVEEAKRTGRPLQSVGSKGHEIVDRDLLEEATIAVSNSDASETSPLPQYLEELRERFDDVDYVREVNEMKAAEHEEYSAELIRAKRDEEAALAKKAADDPMFYANLIAERQRLQVEAYEKEQADFAVQREKNSRGLEERVRAIDVHDAVAATSLETYAEGKAPSDISESFAHEALITKDRVIFGEESFKAVANAAREASQEASTQRTSQKETAKQPEAGVKGKVAVEAKATRVAEEKADENAEG
jgi:hypothetical protein